MKYRIGQSVRRCVNSNGDVVCIRTFKGRIKKCVLETEDQKKLSPIFDSIKYDWKNEVFLVTQGYQDVYEDNRPATMTDNLYFYMNFKGNPISPGYAEFLDKYYEVKLRDKNVFGKDRWFTEFGVTLRNIGLELGQELDKRRKNIKPKMIKMTLENKD